MIIYHNNQGTTNHIYYFGFQPLLYQVFTLTSGAVPSTQKPFIIGGGVGRVGSIIG